MENVSSPFTLEREPTLMPNEFRERMSAKHRSRKSSAAKSSSTRNRHAMIKQPTGTLRYSTEASNLSSYQQNNDTNSIRSAKREKSMNSVSSNEKMFSARQEYDKVMMIRNEALKKTQEEFMDNVDNLHDNGEDNLNEHTENNDEENELPRNRTYTLENGELQDILDNMRQGDTSLCEHGRQSGSSSRNTYIMDRKMSWQNDVHNNDDNNGELASTSSHIELNGDVKFMFDSVYYNQEPEGGFSIKTPPQNMQMKDIMSSLDDWGKEKDVIREKKYAVLPSIHKSSSSGTYRNNSPTSVGGLSSTVSVNNQLDFSRDRMEDDADFFADFRVNTSNIKPTPRQDPLPPIQNNTTDAMTSMSHKHVVN
ncbi:hypothetical protein MAR_007940 [Mya arenaria]|uniref:Uncharacterized protein n=1 Tax=Mya arenaria TaxID=6604 RepID=A0ABY7DX43_MYAAR|nr:hypothetical protein MAR_007940 [Mya arenaria]